MNELTKEKRTELFHQLQSLDRAIAKNKERSKYDFLSIRYSWYPHSQKLEEIEKLKREYREKDLERKRVRNILKGYTIYENREEKSI